MKVRIEVQMPPKGMRDHHNHHTNAILCLRPLLDYGSPQSGKVVKQMTILLEDQPENIQHGEDRSGVWNVRQCSPLVALPQDGGFMAAARACPGFAGMGTRERDFSFVKGLAVAVFAGIMSSFFAFGLRDGKPFADLTRTQLAAVGHTDPHRASIIIFATLWG